MMKNRPTFIGPEFSLRKSELVVPFVRSPNEAWPPPEANDRERSRKKEFFCLGSPQPFEKVQNRQGIPRKSKPFSLIDFARACPDFAGFG
jgi:hypothetical protein